MRGGVIEGSKEVVPSANEKLKDVEELCQRINSVTELIAAAVEINRQAREAAAALIRDSAAMELEIPMIINAKPSHSYMLDTSKDQHSEEFEATQITRLDEYGAQFYNKFNGRTMGHIGHDYTANVSMQSPETEAQ